MEFVTLLSFLGILWLVYAITLVIYRFVFHPLAHIPGPPLGIATYLFEYYWDIWHEGQLTFQLERLHRQYGPIIRFNPDEVHIHDAEYFDEVYTLSNGRTNKPVRGAEVFGPLPAVIGTRPHEIHRLRRSSLSPFFSTKSVNDLQPGIKSLINLLSGRLKDASQTQETLNMKYFYHALTIDIMNKYCFSHEADYLLRPDFGRKAFDDLDGFLQVCLFNYHFPWIMRFINCLPDTINRLLSPAMADVIDFREELSKQIEAIRRGEDKAHEISDHRTVLHDLLSSKLPPPEMKRNRLKDEAYGLVTAGSETSASVLRATSYYISADPAVRLRLFEELKAAMPDPDTLLDFAELEKLPYLSAVVQEGLRLGNPVVHRAGREFPDKTLNYHGILIPAGTSVHMTYQLLLQNGAVFPDPRSFRPERWLEGGKGRLDRYLVTFSRGARACLGINLARAELYLVLAAIHRRFDFNVSQVKKERDIDVDRDHILAAQARDSPGVLVTVKALE